MVKDEERAISAAVENSSVPIVLERFLVLEDAWQLFSWKDLSGFDGDGISARQ